MMKARIKVRYIVSFMCQQQPLLSQNTGAANFASPPKSLSDADGFIKKKRKI
jgi:hypothetical protein